MSAEREHPGYINPQLSGRERASRHLSRSKDQYYPFMDMRGINGGTSELFLRFFDALYAQTFEVWEPSRCRETGFLDEEAQKLLSKGSFEDITVAPRTYFQDHFWLEVGVNGFDIVFDPFGIPERRGVGNDVGKYQPFFGLKENAHGFPKEIYLGGTSLTIYGYRPISR